SFGASARELDTFSRLPLVGVIGYLLNYDRAPDDVDSKINDAAYVGVTTRGQFSPNTVVNDARQRWLFRMVHSQRPFQEKLALFWHNHFATAYTKVAGTFGAEHGTKMMDGKASEVAGQRRGQIQLFRDMGTGRFDEMLIEVAKDPAMLVWLDGRLNVRARPQENFGRELMELFTTGVGHYVEEDVYAAARVFTGWNLRLSGDRATAATSYYEYVYNAAQHDPTAKTFTFAVMPDGSKTIPARAAADGEQDGIDLIRALARRPETANRLARRFFAFFVSEIAAPSDALITEMRDAYLNNDTSIKAMLVRLFTSTEFLEESASFARYSWPIEYVVRAIKETGWSGLSVDAAMTPLVNMGQQLYEPPDVNGWALGAEWFSTASMLSRMNFAATLMANQRFNLQQASAVARSSPEALLDFHLKRFSPAPLSPETSAALLDYLRQGGAWTGADAQLANKAAGLGRLIVGSSEYQFN
ncbi:MAG: DUF1800 domain-containing protein, partial [Acidobacteria bacterium]|nr:DUF1800 domain-containing protein [Acidobacteriota bacterium]